MPVPGRVYDRHHHQLRKQVEGIVLAGSVRCWRCGLPIAPGQPWDLGHDDVDRSVYRGPEHAWCNRRTSSHRLERVPLPAALGERDGLDCDDERWRVPWLRPFLRVPKDATWPRLMSVPHVRAVDSIGADFVRWSDKRAGGR